MQFQHRINITFHPDGKVTAKHVCETAVDVRGRDSAPENVTSTRDVPVGGKTAVLMKDLLSSLRAVNEEAMETICRRDALMIAHAVTVRDAALVKTRGVVGIDTDTDQEIDDAEAGAEGDGGGSGGGDAGGDQAPRTPPVGKRKR